MKRPETTCPMQKLSGTFFANYQRDMQESATNGHEQTFRAKFGLFQNLFYLAPENNMFKSVKTAIAYRKHITLTKRRRKTTAS